MISPRSFVPIPTPVEAVQVTAENAAEVAEWAGSPWRRTLDAFGVRIDQVKAVRAAYPGDWMIRQGAHIDSVDDAEFRRRYQPAEEK